MAVVGDSVQLQYGSITSVKVHPLVLFAITDHFMRRTEQQKRVLGTLLGFCGEGVAHILNTIPVRHTEKQIGKVGTDLNSHTHMKKLYQRVNNKEDIVGWYTTSIDSKDVNFNSCVMHRFYEQEVKEGGGGHSAVHLVMDPSLDDGKVSIRAYISKNIKLGDILQFQEIPVEVVATPAERVGVNAIIQSSIKKGSGKPVVNTPALRDIKPLDDSFTELLNMVTTVSDYVDAVVDGKIKKNSEVGLKIANAVGAIPHLDPESFDRMFNSSVQDLLMVSSLSKLTQLQMAIADQVGQLPFFTP